MPFKKNNSSTKTDKNSLKSSITGDWFFMSKIELNVKNFYDILKETCSYRMEIWEDANILEIELSEKESIDFEPLQPYFRDDVGDKFLKDNQIKTLFMITFPPTQFANVKEVMLRILEQYDGFFCADSEDFTPMVHRS